MCTPLVVSFSIRHWVKQAIALRVQVCARNPNKGSLNPPLAHFGRRDPAQLHLAPKQRLAIKRLGRRDMILRTRNRSRTYVQCKLIIPQCHHSCPLDKFVFRVHFIFYRGVLRILLYIIT